MNGEYIYNLLKIIDNNSNLAFIRELWCEEVWYILCNTLNLIYLIQKLCMRFEHKSNPLKIPYIPNKAAFRN